MKRVLIISMFIPILLLGQENQKFFGDIIFQASTTKERESEPEYVLSIYSAHNASNTHKEFPRDMKYIKYTINCEQACSETTQSVSYDNTTVHADVCKGCINSDNNPNGSTATWSVYGIKRIKVTEPDGKALRIPIIDSKGSITHTLEKSYDSIQITVNLNKPIGASETLMVINGTEAYKYFSNTNYYLKVSLQGTALSVFLGTN